MNCRPGDLAYIVAPDFPPYDRKFVTVVRFAKHDEQLGPCWVVKPEGWIPPLWTVTLSPVGTFCYPDRCLRPIRNPGDDAVDETLEPGYVKRRDEVSA